MNLVKKNFWILFLLCSFFLTGCNKTPPQNVSQQGLAMNGYDPVSYFGGGLKKGFQEVFYKDEKTGFTYYFFSQRNRSKFINNPSRYEPQNGGWCTYGMLAGVKLMIRPGYYRIMNDRLYLFYNASVMNKWDIRAANIKGGVAALIKEAAKQWENKL